RWPQALESARGRRCWPIEPARPRSKLSSSLKPNKSRRKNSGNARTSRRPSPAARLRRQHELHPGGLGKAILSPRSRDARRAGGLPRDLVRMVLLATHDSSRVVLVRNLRRWHQKLLREREWEKDCDGDAGPFDRGALLAGR